jgi:hypothetical protein
MDCAGYFGTLHFFMRQILKIFVFVTRPAKTSDHNTFVSRMAAIILRDRHEPEKSFSGRHTAPDKQAV